MENRLARLAEHLRAWGVGGITASLLESAGPLAFLGAQALYMVGPVLDPLTPEDEISALARMLEDPASVRAFARQLEDPQP